jgi:hypothetical protein
MVMENILLMMLLIKVNGLKEKKKAKAKSFSKVEVSFKEILRMI